MCILFSLLCVRSSLKSYFIILLFYEHSIVGSYTNDKEYASSINKTPPFAFFITCAVFNAVCPIYPATKPDLSVSINCPFDTTPRHLNTLAIIRATVVLPVPGCPHLSKVGNKVLFKL